MENIRIEKPCSEDWNKMTPTEKGAFCQKCTKQVYDFTNLSGNEVMNALKEMEGNNLCGRIRSDQLEMLNHKYEGWKSNIQTQTHQAMIFSLIIVFGLSLFSCNSEEDKILFQQIKETAQQAIHQKNEPQENVEVKAVKVENSPQHVEEIITMGEVAYYPETKSGEQEIENEKNSTPASTKEEEMTNYILGGMSYTPRYSEYLHQTTIEKEVDENANSIPTSFDFSLFPNPVQTTSTIEFFLPS